MTSPRRRNGRSPLLIWGEAILDPRRVARAIREVPRFVRDWRRYARMPSAEPLDWSDASPQLHDRTSATPYDPHYLHLGAWAARRILETRPPLHVDVGSQSVFVAILAAAVPVVFVDYRPLGARLAGLLPVGGNLLALPFADASIGSLSCLHVAEHVGLGRYGDPLDPLGTRKAAAELARVLAPEGDLYVALPVGRPRVCFNAHRIHAARDVRSYFAALDLAEFAGVGDDGALSEDTPLDLFDGASYACGFFHFRRPR